MKIRTALAFVLCLSAAFAQQASRLPSYRALKFPPLKPVRLPEPVTFQLPNGMKVFLLENHELPVISGTALVRTGNLFDSSNRRGVAEITGIVMRTGGTHNKTGEQLDVQLENVAASVESEIGESSATVSFSCLKENADQVLGIFRDVLTEPEFRQDKIDLAKTQLRSSIARRNDDPGGIAAREFAGTVYGKDTPYGWDINYEHVNAINRFDLNGFYNRYFYPANIMLAIYGDFKTPDMKAKVEGLLGGWKYGPLPPRAFPEVSAKPAPGIYLAEKPDVTQTFLELGQLGGELRDKDFPALAVAADILGGGFSSRLVKRVRTDLGYAYDISAGWGAEYDHPGLFTIAGSTQSKYTEATISVILEEVEKMRTQEVSDQELQTAKDSVENSFVFLFDKPSRTLVRLLTYEYYGYPKDFIFDYQKGVAAVTKADVLKVAKQYWRPKDFVIVAVGNPKDFGTPLSSMGLPMHKVDLTIPEPKPQSEASQVDPALLQKGKELLARVQEALGGADKLALVKDAQNSMEARVESSGGQMKVKQKNFFLAPSSFRQELELPVGSQMVFSDGKSGWMVSGKSTMALPPGVVQQVQDQVFHQLFWLALSDRDADRTVSAKGDTAIEISNKAGQHAALEIDRQTALPIKLSYASGASEVEELYSDWRQVNGIRLPFEIVINQDGKKFASFTIQSYQINSGLTADQLSKKP